MFESVFEMVKIIFVMFKITPKCTFNHLKTIPYFNFILLNIIFILLKLFFKDKKYFLSVFENVDLNNFRITCK